MNLRFLLPVLLLFCFELNSQNAVIFSVANSTVNTEDDFVMNVKTQNFTDVSSFSFSMNWDETLVDFDTIITFNGDLPLNVSNFNITPLVTNTGKLAISWFDISGVGKSLADNTTLFEIKFKALTNPGSTLLEFTDELTPIIAENLQGVLPVSTIPGIITVQAVNSTNVVLTWGDITIYPNPAQEYVMLQYSIFHNASPVVVEIMDLNGKLLGQQKHISATFGEIRFDITSFLSGTYIIRMVSDEGVVFKKLSIAR